MRRLLHSSNASKALAAAAAVLLAGGALLYVSADDDDDASDSSSTGAVVGGDLHSVVADPTEPGRLFVGGHQAVSVSDDGGVTWRRVPSLDDKDAMGWAFADDAIYVSGHPGLNRSTDGGLTFTAVNEGLPHTDVHAFGAGGGVLYGGSPAVGVFASEDDGDTWKILTGDAGQSFFGRILVDPDDPQHLFAADASAGVAQSRDGGRSWQQVGPLASATWITAPTDSLDVVIASGPAGAARSEDGGETWEPFDLPANALLAELSPDGETVYAASHRGNRAQLSVSSDGGRTWSDPE